MALRRIAKELKDFEKNPPENIEVSSDKDNGFHWNAKIHIVDERSPHKGGTFNLLIRFPTDYPFKPPKLKFLNKMIFHPNFGFNGSICCCSGGGTLGD